MMHKQVTNHLRPSERCKIFSIVRLKFKDVNQRFHQSTSKNGTVKKVPECQKEEELAVRALPILHFCKPCGIIQPFRTKHCYKCKACIARSDHHCYWMGSLSSPQTVASVKRTTASTGRCSSSCGQNTSLPPHTYLKIISDLLHCHLKPPQPVPLLVDLLVRFLIHSLLRNVPALSKISLNQILLFLYHTYLLLTNQSTWEHTKRKDIDYLNVYPDRYLPFDHGVYNNIVDCCCIGDGFKKWELPDVQTAWSQPYRSTCLNNSAINILC